MDPLDEVISRGRVGMVRELHPAGTHDEDSGTGSGRRPERSGALADDPTATRDSEALPDAATTLPAPPQPPGDALDDPPSAVAAAPSTSTSTRHLPIYRLRRHPPQPDPLHVSSLEQHMREASEQRAREAAESGRRRGSATARTKWSEAEIARFKEALARLGPGNNAALAAAVGTRDKQQITTFKSRFLKANPTWLEENHHPAQPTATTSGSRRSSTRSPASTQGRSPIVSTILPPHTRASQRQPRAGDARTRRATSKDKTGRAGRATSTSPASAASGTPPTADTPSPSTQASTPTTQEERTPSPLPAPISRETAQRLERLDKALSLLRPNPITQWEPEPQECQSQAHNGRAGTTPGEETPRPQPMEEMLATLNQHNTELMEKALAILSQPNIQLWDPELEILSPSLEGIHTPPPTPPLATVTERRHCSPGLGVDLRSQLTVVTALPAPATAPPLATVTERRHCSPGVGVDLRPQSQRPPTPAIHTGETPRSSPTEEAPVSIFQSLLHAQEFIPRTFSRTRQADELLRPPRGEEAPSTSPPPMPPSSPVHTPPSTTASARQRCGSGAGVAVYQLLPPPPPAGEANPPTPPTSPGLPSPLACVPGPPPTITIDPERMDETLRIPMYQVIPFSGRQLGAFEWVAFEEVLMQWSTAIREVVTAQHRRPPNPTSQWARRRMRRAREGEGCPPSPSPDPELPPDPSQQTEVQEQDQNTTTTRASGRARRAAKARHLQRLYRANPGVCMRRLLETKGGDVTLVQNWRPISLQLTLYKLYSGIIARRIATWATETLAFSAAQKGFLAFDGCAEHNFLLRSMMTDSRRRKRNLLLAWLDLRDAFGSVPHHLMLSTMERLGLSGSVLKIVRDIYSHSTVAIRTGRDSFTSAIPQNRGVKQGCPLSPILFNIVLESLLKYLTTNKAGYTLAEDSYNSLAYADDICVAASTKEELQSLLDQCKEFADWAGLAFKVKKCGSLCLVNESHHAYVDHLFTPHLGTEAIPALSWEDRYRYLGCPVGAYRTPTKILDELREGVLRDCGIVFTSELAEWQKLDAYRRFLFPRLSFVLKVVFPGAIWCRKLDTAIRAVIKRGLHLPPRTCTQYLYLSQALGGMGIPSVEDESHVARSAQAFKFLSDSRDVRVRNVAINQLVATVAKRAPYLDPTDPGHLERWLNTSAGPLEGRAGDLQSLWSAVRQSLILTSSSIRLTEESATLHTTKHTITWDRRKLLYQVLKEGTNDRHLTILKRSADQGRATFSTSLHPDSTFFTYTGAFLSFPQYRFIHRARLNLLPVRTVQARCHRPVPNTQCRTCGRVPETLAHVLNHCHSNLGMARERHNAILERIVRAVPEFLGTKMKEQPIPGTTGDNRPDLTIISPCGTRVTLVEVSCPFEGTPTALEDAANLKVTKYEPLRQQLLQTYAEVTILPFIVGSLGSWFPDNDRVLSTLRIGRKYAALMRRLCVVSAIAGSQNIWYQAMCKSHHRPTRGAAGPAGSTGTDVAASDGTAADGGGPAIEAGISGAAGGHITPQGSATSGEASDPATHI
eukprot:Em0007g1056a